MVAAAVGCGLCGRGNAASSTGVRPQCRRRCVLARPAVFFSLLSNLPPPPLLSQDAEERPQDYGRGPRGYGKGSTPSAVAQEYNKKRGGRGGGQRCASARSCCHHTVFVFCSILSQLISPISSYANSGREQDREDASDSRGQEWGREWEGRRRIRMGGRRGIIGKYGTR